MKRRNFLATMAGAAILASLRPAYGQDANRKTLIDISKIEPFCGKRV